MRTKALITLIISTLIPLQSLSLPQNQGSNPTKRRVLSSGINSYHNQNNQKSSKHLNSLFTLQLDQISLNKWITTSLTFFKFHRCTKSNIGSDDECFKLNQSLENNTGGIAIYLGWDKRQKDLNILNSRLNQTNESVQNNKDNASGGGGGGGTGKTKSKVYAILPDSNTAKASGPHDYILALDPYSGANFGHLIALFYIDLAQEGKNCKEEWQVYLPDSTCITVAKKPRCPNLLERFTTGSLGQPKRCHIDFLPTVYPSERVNSPPMLLSDLGLQSDLLECLPLPGFASCPKLRSVEDTSKVLCDSAQSNSKRCDTSHFLQGAQGIGTNCKLFQTCDQAVLLGGGWNRIHSGVQSFHNILSVENSLKKDGFLVENIKTFYANGKKSSGEGFVKQTRRRAYRNSVGSSLTKSSYFSSAMKTGLRGHIRSVCETRHCADTLFLYLNNPTTSEGDMLLWDVDYNGIADELEVYTVKELLSDLNGCEAKRVLILADQSNTDILMASLKSSTEHSNVILFTAGLPNQTPINGEFTKIWANNSSPVNCLKHVQETTSSQMNSSNPAIYDPTHGITSKLSIIGAPCDLNPPVNSKELKSLYQGCQNVPTSIWFSFNFEELGDLGEEDEESIIGSGGTRMSSQNQDTFSESLEENSPGTSRRHQLQQQQMNPQPLHHPT